MSETYAEERMPQLLTASDVADVLAVSEPLVRRLVERGELGAFRVGARSLRFTADDVTAYLERHREAVIP